MAFWTVKTDNDSVADGGSGNYIIDSGMYDVIIKNCIVRHGDESAGKKSVWLDLIVDYNGTVQTIYRAINLKNNDGSASFSERMLNKLCIVCGAKDGFELNEPVTKSVCTNQKEGTYEEVPCLEELEDQQVTLRILKEYKLYNGEIRRYVRLMNVFRTTDKKSAKEIAQNKEAKQYAIEENTCKETSYKDGITPEEASEYENNRSNGASTPAKPKEQPKRRFGFSGSEDSHTDSVPF